MNGSISVINNSRVIIMMRPLSEAELAVECTYLSLYLSLSLYIYIYIHIYIYIYMIYV